MRAQKRKVLVASALLDQTCQPNRGPTHPGLPQNSHAWTPENWRTTARTTQTTSSSTVSSTRKTRNHGAKEVQNEPEHQQWRSQIRRILSSICPLFPGPRPPIYNGLPQRVPGIFALCLGVLDTRLLRWSVLLPRKPCPGLSTGFEG